MGSSQDDLKAFPKDARRELGFELGEVQRGEQPSDWKPMNSIGTGVFEIRVHRPNQYRLLYIARFSEAIYVLHAFEKKTRKTSPHDIAIARKRLALVENQRRKLRG